MFYNISYISKVNLASLNGSEGMGGNITPIKKITDNRGNEYVYVSGQAQRRYLKETLWQMDEKITSVDTDGNPDLSLIDKIIKDEKTAAKDKDNRKKELMFSEYCDLDLFGYMFPKGGRRWSPVKVAPMISIFPYKGEFDYLTRKQYVEDEAKKSGNIVQVEIDTFNFMRGNIMIDVERIGNDVNEYNYEMTPYLDEKAKNARINKLIDAIRYLNGGAKQSRNLENISPKFVVIIKQKTGNPFLLNSIKMDKKEEIDIDIIIEEVKENQALIEEVCFGISKGIFNNEEAIIKTITDNGYKCTGITEAFEILKKQV